MGNNNKEEFNMERTKMTTKTMVVGSLLTALVFVLQFMGAAIKFGTFSISPVLIPIVIGAVSCGKGMGAWLGFVFGGAVLASGDAAIFLQFSVVGTVLTVLLKGAGCGFAAGLVYELVCKTIKKPYFATVAASLICPVVNTGIFLLGCKLFLMDAVAHLAGGGVDLGKFMIFVLVGANFLVEMAVNIIFAPAIVYIIKVVSKDRDR